MIAPTKSDAMEPPNTKNGTLLSPVLAEVMESVTVFLVDKLITCPLLVCWFVDGVTEGVFSCAGISSPGFLDSDLLIFAICSTTLPTSVVFDSVFPTVTVYPSEN